MTNLDKNFWQNRYVNNQTGWDLGMASPPLSRYVEQCEDKHLRILIPGAGNAYEAQLALTLGFQDITVIDIASNPIEALAHAASEAVADGRLKLICGDFFCHQGVYDLMLEQTFFCAIDPGLRAEYASHTSSLLSTGGKVRGVLFNRTFEGGPPFGGHVSDYHALFEPHFTRISMESCYNSALPRAGSEVWIKLDV